eukprot:8927591-Alexandrium_andersonii.AAC.1
MLQRRLLCLLLLAVLLLAALLLVSVRAPAAGASLRCLLMPPADAAAADCGCRLLLATGGCSASLTNKAATMLSTSTTCRAQQA